MLMWRSIQSVTPKPLFHQIRQQAPSLCCCCFCYKWGHSKTCTHFRVLKCSNFLVTREVVKTMRSCSDWLEPLFHFPEYLFRNVKFTTEESPLEIIQALLNTWIFHIKPTFMCQLQKKRKKREENKCCTNSLASLEFTWKSPGCCGWKLFAGPE